MPSPASAIADNPVSTTIADLPQAGQLNSEDMAHWRAEIVEWARSEVLADEAIFRRDVVATRNMLAAAERLAVAEVQRLSAFTAWEAVMLFLAAAGHSDRVQAIVPSEIIIGSKLLRVPAVRMAASHWRWMRLQEAMQMPWQVMSGWSILPDLTLKVRSEHLGWHGTFYRHGNGRDLMQACFVLPSGSLQKSLDADNLREDVRLLSLTLSEVAAGVGNECRPDRQGLAVMHRDTGRMWWHEVPSGEKGEGALVLACASEMWQRHVLDAQPIEVDSSVSTPLEEAARDCVEAAAADAAAVMLDRATGELAVHYRGDLQKQLAQHNTAPGSLVEEHYTVEAIRKSDGVRYRTACRRGAGLSEEAHMLARVIDARVKDLHGEISSMLMGNDQ